MLKPPTIPVIQFLNEVIQGRQSLEYYFENWFPRLAKYRKDNATRLSNEELLAKTIAIATPIYNERANAIAIATPLYDKRTNTWKRQIEREFGPKDEFLLSFVDSWCYHWAMREGFYRQQAEKKGKAPKSADLEKLDEETLSELAGGRTFNAERILGSNARDFNQIFRSKLSGRNDWKCDLWEDLVFVDLCRNYPTELYPLFVDRFTGYFTTCITNKSRESESLRRLRDDDFRIAIDDAFMATIAPVQKDSDGSSEDEMAEGKNKDEQSKGANGHYRGLCGLKNWVLRVLVNGCIAIVKTYPKGDGADLDRQRSRELDDITIDERELVEKYLKTFQKGFWALPLEIQLALRVRFDHVLAQEKGRPITNVADFTDGDLSAVATLFRLSLKKVKSLVQGNRSAIEKLVPGLFEDARQKGLGFDGLKVLMFWALKTVGVSPSEEQIVEGNKERE